LCSKHDPFDKKYLCLLRVWLLPNVLFLVPTSELKCNYDILCVVSMIHLTRNVTQNMKYLCLLRVWLLPNVLCYSWCLHPNCVLNLHLRHSRTCLFTVKLEKKILTSFFFQVYLAPLYHKSLSTPSFHDYALLWGTVCVKLLHKLA